MEHNKNIDIFESVEYSISEISELLNIPASAIRFYESKGLIKPNRNKESNYRTYNYEMVVLLDDIIRYRALGISIEQIKSLLFAPVDEAVTILDKTIDNTYNQIVNMQRALQKLSLYERKIRNYLSYNNMENQFEIVDEPWMREVYPVVDKEDMSIYFKNHEDVEFGLFLDTGKKKTMEESLICRCIFLEKNTLENIDSVWSRNSFKGKYVKWMLNCDYGKTSHDNLSLIYDYFEKNNLKIGKTICQYIVYDENKDKEIHDYYFAYTEILE